MRADEEALARIKAAKSKKSVNRALANCEIEIAKAVASIAASGDAENITSEVIKLLTAICVSTTERYMASDEDQRMFLDALHTNIEDLHKFMKEANVEGTDIEGGA